MPPPVGGAAGGDPTGATGMGMQVLGSTLAGEQEKLNKASGDISDDTAASNLKTTTAPIADGMVASGNAGGTAGADGRARSGSA